MRSIHHCALVIQLAVAAIVQYAGRLYRWVALATAGIGLSIVPFLDALVNLDQPVERLNVYYIVMLSSAVASFLMYGRTLLLEADQRAYWFRLVSVLFNVARSALQICTLLIWHSFLLYLVVQTVSTVLTNLVVFRHVGHAYSYIRHGSELEEAPRRDIRRSVRAMTVYRVSGLALNNTDPIIISAIVGTLTLGVFSNYMLIVGSAVMIIEVMFQALTPSVGSLVASGEPDAIRRVFHEIQILGIGVYGTAAVVLGLTLNDVVRLWLGEDFTLPATTVLAIVLNFYLMGSLAPVFAFRIATGLFRQARYILVVAAVVNLGLSVLMGKYFGLAGVLYATALARLSTNFWYEPMLLFRRHLHGGARRYVGTQFVALVMLGASYLGIALGVSSFQAPIFTKLLTKLLIAALVLPIGLWVLFRKTEGWAALSGRLSGLLNRSKV